ncbi:hypothetical protein BSKO_07199 [Bryopsis sp. KO-2023]|nr:hypothetical protein BSKO_07199 [Bryopsis sp. KO-2023]
MMRATLCLVIATTCLVGSSLGACTKDHPKVGLSAELSTLEHDVEGTIVVVDDCTFKVENFKYDGTGPDVFWYAADEKANLEAGYILDSIPRSDGVWDGTREVTITLAAGTTWDDVNVISVWCRQFGINFGYAELPEPAAGTPDEEPEMEKVTLTSNEKKEKTPKAAVEMEPTEATGSLSGGSLGSFSGGSISSVSSESTSSFTGGSASTRGSATAQAAGGSITELKQKESPSDEFDIDQVEKENGSATAKTSLLFLLGTFAIGLLFGTA